MILSLKPGKSLVRRTKAMTFLEIVVVISIAIVVAIGVWAYIKHNADAAKKAQEKLDQHSDLPAP